MNTKTDTVNYYTRHLSQVNVNNAVLASEDIRNSQGAVIVAKGLMIDSSLAKRIAQHKLSKAIDLSISIEKHFSASKMYDRMQKHLDAVGLKSLINAFQLENVIKLYLEHASNQPVIRLKLSVLAECLPEVFNRSLVCAGISLALCKELKTDGDTAKNVFIAALLADTGLLHIDPEVAAEKGQFSAEQWLLYQGHVAISKSISDMVPNLNKQVGRAIMEHHERSDGFGYPLQKFGDELCLEGRILAKADTIMAIYRKRVLQEGYAFSVIIPVLQFSPDNYNPEVNNAAVRLLFKVSSGLAPSNRQESVIDLIPKLVLLIKRLDFCLTSTQTMIDKYEKQLSKPEALRHVHAYNQLKYGIDSSGLLSSHQREWLLGIFKTKKTDESHVVEQFAVMLFEIQFQCQQAYRHFSPLIPTLFGSGEDGQFVQKGTDKLGEILNTLH